MSVSLTLCPRALQTVIVLGVVVFSIALPLQANHPPADRCMSLPGSHLEKAVQQLRGDHYVDIIPIGTYSPEMEKQVNL